MPIINLQRRHAELGRIRLGQKVPVGTSGKSRPDKLDRFRFTSPNPRLVESLADLYGGTARPWDNNGKPEHEVITDAKSIPVVVIKGGMSQWWETWSGGGCVHRCDGEKDPTGAYCDPDDPKHAQAKATTRLSVMLLELGAIGVFRLETHGINAAIELPALVDIAMTVGDLVPAHLVLHERRSVVDGKTSRYVVPGLDLDVTPRQLVAITQAAQAGTQTPTAVGASTPPTAIGSTPSSSAPQVDWDAALANASTVEECQTVWRQAGEAGALTDALKETIKARARELTPEPASATEALAPDPEIGESADNGPDADVLWSSVVAEAGRQNLTDGDVRGAFLAAFQHGVSEATAPELETFLREMKAAA